MAEFQLFRIQVHVQPRLPLGDGEPTPPEALLEAVLERPSKELRRTQVWHIGNVVPLDSTSLRFAVGRIAKSRVPAFDERRKDFVESERETAPFSHAVLDVGVEVIAIAANTKLSRRTTQVARRFEELLNASAIARQGVSFTVLPIADPASFIRRLHEAHAVKRFSFSFGPPNAFDINRQIVQPAQRAVNDLNAHRGSMAFEGGALSQQRLEDLARSTAAVGQRASASVQEKPDEKPVNIHLSGNAVLFREDIPDGDEALWARILDRMREKYRHVRGSSGDTES